MNSSLLSNRGLERRLKKHLLKKQFHFIAITTPGFESVLCEELKSFPAIQILDKVTGGVEFQGDFDSLYLLNLYLRTANRILMRIETFTARSYPELYNKSKRIPWELYCGFNEFVSFSASSRTSRLHHTGNIEAAVSDALTECLGKLGVKIQVCADAPLCFHIRMAQDTCTISIDTSGELLYKRGYRFDVARAPIRETTASAILMISKWSSFPVIMDPLCGSGTFLIEAALMAHGYAPGVCREFAFACWPSYNERTWVRIKANAESKKKECVSLKLFGSDIDTGAITASITNAQRAGVDALISFKTADCLSITPPADSGLLISNLPYGKRVGVDEQSLDDFLKKFGTTLRSSFSGWNFAFVVADDCFEKKASLESAHTVRFSNGGIPVRLVMGKI